MSLFVDTSVWSLALRRTGGAEAPEVLRLRHGLSSRESIMSTGLVLQELLQGFQGARAKEQIVRDFSVLPVIVPAVDDHIEAALLRNHCRRQGVQIGTIDALIGQICIRHDLRLLTTDRDFRNMAAHCPLSLVMP